MIVVKKLKLKYNKIMDQNSMMGGVPPMQNQNNSMNGANFGGQQQPMGSGMPPMGAAPMQPAPAGAGMSMSYANMAPIAEPKKKNGSLLETIILVVVCLIAAGAIVVAVIFFMRYHELQTSYESDLALEVAEVEKTKQEEINAAVKDYADKQTTEFTGPSDYGSISFQYPKSWNVYVDNDGSKNSDYKSYFSPNVVSPINDSDSRYALRFFIYNRSYEDVSRTYNEKTKNGELSSSVFSADGGNITGMRYEGMVDNDINGVIILIKVNDKTVELRTDSASYRANFDALVTTLRRNS